MITPSKYLPPGRDLLSVGAKLLAAMPEPITVSELWERLQTRGEDTERLPSFDWFILALCFLFSINAIALDKGVLTRANS
jgi:hypothetical protein